MAKHSKQKPKRIPEFASEAEGRAFWGEHDSTEYSTGVGTGGPLPNLQPSTATISLRLPQGMLDELKVLAHQRDVPYQSLLEVFLSERLARERRRARRKAAGV